MYRNKHIIFGTLLLALCPAFSRAERIPHEHDFQSMVSKSEIVVTNSNTTAATDLLTYQCSGTNAIFAKDHYAGTYWSFKLLNYGSTVTTTKINELDEFTVAVVTDYGAKSCDNLKVKVSKDSITWSGPLTSSDSISYTANSITVTLPRNNYYVRLYNTNGAKDVSITSIVWYQDHCNCFTYEP